MEDCHQSIVNLQVSTMEELMTIFIDEHHVYGHGQSTIDIASFAKMVEKEVGRRDDGKVAPAPADGCCLM